MKKFREWFAGKLYRLTVKLDSSYIEKNKFGMFTSA
jgi:hypothetical protein